MTKTEMSSIDMCEHDWSGSGCRECFPKVAEAASVESILRGQLEKLVEKYEDVIIYQDFDDEVGTRECCGVRSYKPHEKDCFIVKTKEILKNVKVRQNVSN